MTVERVILVHGLWMRGFVMSRLAHRLAEAGYAVESFDYASVAAPITRGVERLRSRLRAAAGPVHVVGHSLGGLVALMACRDDAGLPPGRIVGLGVPATGSAAARTFEKAGAGWLLGRNAELLARGLAPWDGHREVGIIAGHLGLGLGARLGHVEGAHDGTVADVETRLPGITDHASVAASHTGLLFSEPAATATLEFLRDGRFHDSDA